MSDAKTKAIGEAHQRIVEVMADLPDEDLNEVITEIYGGIWDAALTQVESICIDLAYPKTQGDIKEASLINYKDVIKCLRGEQ